jgi:hypothetical protein
MVDVMGLKPKFQNWMTRLKADLPKTGVTTSLSDTVAIEQRAAGSWEVVQAGLEVPEGMPPLPVHPVNGTLSRRGGNGTKEVNNVGRYYAAKWEAGKAARERVGRVELPPPRK